MILNTILANNWFIENYKNLAHGLQKLTHRKPPDVFLMNRRDFLNGTYSMTLAAAALPLLKVMPAMASTISEADDGSVRQRSEQSQESGANEGRSRRLRQQSARTLQIEHQQPLEATDRRGRQRRNEARRDASRVDKDKDSAENLRRRGRQR
ncbi:MAG: hypothetical protein IBX53_06400 [Halomonas sp.]|uniref:hypothetical protein n=1 Tax=Halomonas sp. TaxID=1486246 RepID=UPI0019EB21F1|nr:hypothetical protein [Halomonas sp.]MBE0488692.1 hypothetical protein [Halomonas sp.]